jgi:hypothetical protein
MSEPPVDSRARRIGTHVIEAYGLDPNVTLEARLVMTPNDQWVEVRLRLTPAALDAAIAEASSAHQTKTKQ